ncbi:MAG: O-antigen ligase family protein [Gemmatimonadaceae bacterium]
MRDAGVVPAVGARAVVKDEGVALVLVGVVCLASVGVLAVTANPVFAFLPLLLTVAGYAMWVLPLRYSFYPLLFLVIIADVGPRDPYNPAVAWRSPVNGLQRGLLDNLNMLLGVEAMRFSGTELLLLLLLGLCAVRTLAGVGRDAHGRVPLPKPVYAALALSSLVVVALEVWGAARGGDVRQSLWQFRQIAWLPMIAIVAGQALRDADDYVMVGKVVTLAAAVKVVIGIIYFRLVAAGGGSAPATVTSHHDTVLFVVVVAFWILRYVHRRTPRQLAATALVSAWIMLGMVLNNRRTAWVSLVAVLVTLFVLQPARPRRKGYRVLLHLFPMLVLYVYAGNYQTTGIFKPAASVISVFADDNASNSTRDIENFNLIQTIKQNKLVGSGWGHMYSEQSVAYDISGAFEQYRYIAHNSVLWLWSIGGLLGFTGLWMVMGIGIFFSARSYHLASDSTSRVAASLAIATFVAFIVQAWADMGTQSWTIVLLVACAVTASGKLAAATGGWVFPAPRRRVGALRPVGAR